MKQAEDRRTAELPGLSHDETGNPHQRKTGAPRGAYRGAVKIGCHAHALRAKTGKSQAEFARMAGVSERSLRSWEASHDPARDCPKVHAAIVAQLAALGVSYTSPNAPRRTPVRYRCPMTGSTWTGRGLKPAWLRVALEDGRTLAEFEQGRAA